MGLVHRWTAGDDRMIRTLRGCGESWEAIAGVLGVSVGACQVHASRGGMLSSAVPRVPPPRTWVLPAGDAVSWGLITAGTLLEGVGWPGVVWNGHEG